MRRSDSSSNADLTLILSQAFRSEASDHLEVGAAVSYIFDTIIICWLLEVIWG